MKLEFEEYRARTIVNIHKHVDGPWFWDKYSAKPYVGCRSGCEFCYLRGSHYLGKRHPDTFDNLIQVKTNAVELLRKQLSRLERDVIVSGDWQQPAEDRYRLSRKMLEVVLDLAFPLLIIERSPFLTRDLDLLVEINRKSWVGVIYSISNLDPTLKHAFEPHSPAVRRRLDAMERLSSAGILIGTSLIPIIPFSGDDKHHLEEVIRATVDHGGSFVVAAGMTMQGVQAERTLEAARRFDPALEISWRELYSWGKNAQLNYATPRAYTAELGLMVRELCSRHGLRDRMPRYLPPGPLAINKRIAEQLFLKTYELELQLAQAYRIWAYRKAAWTVDELPISIEDLYKSQGEPALLALPGIGKRMCKEIIEKFGEYS